MRRIVVVGAGLAGLRSAEALRRAEFDGELTLVGDEPYEPYNRPPLSKQVLGGTQDVAECQFKRDIDITLRLGSRAVGLDRSGSRVLLQDGSAVPYDGLVVATGVRARTLADLPDATGVFTLRGRDDAVAFRAAALGARRVAIVGAGLIGCEAAATLRKLDVEVALIDFAPRPVMPLGEAIGERVAEWHAKNGVELFLSAQVAGVASDGGAVTGVRLEDGSVVAADVVLLALGGVPNVDWLAGSGLDADERSGLRCDAFCAALGAPEIVAAGDVAEFDLGNGERARIEHWSNANDMADAAAHNLLLPVAQRKAYRPVPSMWTDQYDMRVQSVGFVKHAESWRTVEDEPGGGKFVIEGMRGEQLVAAIGVNAARQMLRYRMQLNSHNSAD